MIQLGTINVRFIKLIYWQLVIGLFILLKSEGRPNSFTADLSLKFMEIPSSLTPVFGFCFQSSLGGLRSCLNSLVLVGLLRGNDFYVSSFHSFSHLLSHRPLVSFLQISFFFPQLSHFIFEIICNSFHTIFFFLPVLNLPISISILSLSLVCFPFFHFEVNLIFQIKCSHLWFLVEGGAQSIESLLAGIYLMS